MGEVTQRPVVISVGGYVVGATAKAVLLTDASGKLAQDSVFLYDAATDTLSIDGIGFTGAANTLTVSIAGSPQFTMDANSFASSTSGSWSLRNVGATDTVPTICPNQVSTGTGIGSIISGSLSLICSSLELSRFTKNSGSSTKRIQEYLELGTATGNETAHEINVTANKATSGDDIALRIKRTDTSSPGTSYYLDCQTGGVTNWTVTAGGYTAIGHESPAAMLDVVGDTRLGDSDTNYVAVENDGDLVFVGGAGLEHGQISADTKTDTIATASSFTWYQITTFDTNGPSNGSCAPDHTNDHITIGKSGDYEVCVSINCHGPAATHNWYVQANVNNNATKLPITRMRVKTDASQDWVSFSRSGTATLSAGDTVELWVYRTSAGSNIDLTVGECGLSVKQLGG